MLDKYLIHLFLFNIFQSNKKITFMANFYFATSRLSNVRVPYDHNSTIYSKGIIFFYGYKM